MTKVLNPRTNRMINVGSAIWKRLVRQGLIDDSSAEGFAVAKKGGRAVFRSTAKKNPEKYDFDRLIVPDQKLDIIDRAITRGGKGRAMSWAERVGRGIVGSKPKVEEGEEPFDDGFGEDTTREGEFGEAPPPEDTTDPRGLLEEKDEKDRSPINPFLKLPSGRLLGTPKRANRRDFLVDYDEFGDEPTARLVSSTYSNRERLKSSRRSPEISPARVLFDGDVPSLRRLAATEGIIFPKNALKAQMQSILRDRLLRSGKVQFEASPDPSVDSTPSTVRRSRYDGDEEIQLNRRGTVRLPSGRLKRMGRKEIDELAADIVQRGRIRQKKVTPVRKLVVPAFDEDEEDEEIDNRQKYKRKEKDSEDIEDTTREGEFGEAPPLVEQGLSQFKKKPFEPRKLIKPEFFV